MITTAATTPTITPPASNGELLPQHLVDLRRSGLSDATIRAAGLFSTSDPAEISRILNWDRPANRLGPCLVIPFHHLDGSLNGFARVRPDNPRKDAAGKPVKYEQPRGESPKAYFTPGVVGAVTTSLKIVGFTEGEKKAMAADQAGYPCIGLTGVFAWTKGKDGDSRKLIDDLAAIDWNDFLVWICFDTDETRNPHVNHARAELVRTLSDLGAKVRLTDLPLGPRGKDGLPEKTGIDDFIVRHGEQAFRDLVTAAMREDSPPQSLEEYREQLARARLDSVGVPGIYLDRSPTGAGKSYADVAAMRKAETSLTVLGTHRNCKEVAEMLTQLDLRAAAYPCLRKRTCENHSEAAAAIEAGLSASAAICPACEFSATCTYRDEMADADAAAHRVATHRRAALNFDSVANGRQYVAIHEDPAGLSAPTAEIATGFDQVATVARQAGEDATSQGSDDRRYFFWMMEKAADWLARHVHRAEETTALDLPTPAGRPPGIDAALFRAMGAIGVFAHGDAVRICRGLASGDVAEVAIRVDKILLPGRISETRKSIVAVWRTKLPEHAAVWLNDATADAEEIRGLVDRPVIDRTPPGRLEDRHPIEQIPLDIKKSTSPRTVLAILWAVLAAYPGYNRIGVICDRRHVSLVKGTARKHLPLGPASQARIIRVEHFRSGANRGSNEWIADCDCLIVLGTPRVPPTAVKLRMIQAGKAAAAARDGRWGRDWWSGVDTSGKRRTVRCLAYRDHDWHAAHHALVAAELLQSVGRGRAICEHGIPVVVVSNEPLGLPIRSREIQPLSSAHMRVLGVLGRTAQQRELTEPFSKIYIGNTSDNDDSTADDLTEQNSKGASRLAGDPITSQEVAILLDKSDRWARQILTDLANQGLVKRVGQRGGWLDHFGSTKIRRGEEEIPAFVSEPYGLSVEAVESAVHFAKTVGCELHISATSEWFPTRTLRLLFVPADETARGKRGGIPR